MSPKTHEARTSRSDAVLTAIFLLTIALPLAAKIVQPDRAVASQENRRLASFPKLDFRRDTLTAFPAAFETYYNDQFGFREFFIRWHHLIKLRLLGVSPSPKVVLGKDGWMFDRDTVQYYNAPPLPADSLEKWQRFLEERQSFVTSKGYLYLAVFAPVSSTIYPEFLPDTVRNKPRESRLDQLLTYLRARSSILVVDLRGALRAGKDVERVYHRTDTHWNELGAYRGYCAIMHAIGKRISGAAPWPRAAFETRERITSGGDVARLLGLSDIFREQRFELVPHERKAAHVAEWYPEGSTYPMGFCMRTDDVSKPRAIVFHDSFTFESLYLFLAESFSETWFHWNHFFGPDLDVKLLSATQNREFSWRPDEQPGLRGSERPVIVIQEIAERQLLYDAPRTWEEQAYPRRMNTARCSSTTNASSSSQKSCGLEAEISLIMHGSCNK